MKKKIDTEALANELNQTGFFRRPTPPQDPAPQPTNERTGDRTVRTAIPPHLPEQARTPRTGRTPPTPPRRQMIRHPFEVYSDQVEKLRQFALEERRNGGVGSMSKMVRDALDRLITERSGGE